MVMNAEWDEEENCVYCTFFIDEEAYPDIVRGIRHGYMHDVSMGCQVEEGECSICKAKATTERDWCSHLKQYKGKTDPASGKKVYEKNRGLKFIELSVVGDGAFDTCEIHELYEPDEIISYANQIENKLEKVSSDISLLASMVPKQKEERFAYEKCLRTISGTANKIRNVKEAQVAGQLVGSQALGVDAAAANATVSHILQFLGIDPASGLNVLDLLNLALNFLEVSVMNLFSKKDNVDLAHVGKITKAMADLQNTMQDLLEEGVASQPSAAAPAAQPPMGDQAAQPGPTPEPVAPQVEPTMPGVGAPQGNVGEVIGPATAKTVRDVLTKLATLKELNDLITEDDQEQNFNNDKGVNNNLMSFIKELKHNLSQDGETFSVSSPSGEEIRIASNGTVTAYLNGEKSEFAPALNDEEMELVKSGDIKTASNKCLNRFVKVSQSEWFANDIPSITQEVNMMDKKESEDAREEELDEYRTEPEEEVTLEERNEDLRSYDYDKTTQEALGIWAWNSRKGVKVAVMERLLKESRLGVEEEKFVQERLESYRKFSDKKKHTENIDKVIEALANTAIKHGMHPKEVLAQAVDVAEMGPDPIGLSKDIKDEGGELPMDDPAMPVVDEMSEQVDEESTPADLAETLKSVLTNLSDALKAVSDEISSALDNGEVVDPMEEDISPSDQEAIDAELSIKTDTDDPMVTNEDTQAASSGYANTMDQLGVSADDALAATKGMGATAIHRAIQLQRTASATESRQRNFARISYYGFNKKASREQIRRTLIGHLADYTLTEGYNFNPKNIAHTVDVMSMQPSSGKNLIVIAHNEKNSGEGRVVEASNKQITSSDDKKEALKERYAQLMPAPAVQPSGQQAVPTSATDVGGGLPTPDAALGDPGVLPPDPMTDPAAEEPMEPDMNMGGGEDYTPGMKRPWGTVCPQCQSTNVEVAGGTGKCLECNAQLVYEMSVKVVPPDKGENYKGNLDNKSSGEGVGTADDLGAEIADAGLAGATAPEPVAPAPAGGAMPGMEAPAAPDMGGGMAAQAPGLPAAASTSPNAMFRISWVTDPSTFVKTASDTKVVGDVCVKCGSNNTSRGSKAVMCSDCKALMPFKIRTLDEIDDSLREKLESLHEDIDENSLISSISFLV
jgi:hypothetical protein